MKFPWFSRRKTPPPPGPDEPGGPAAPLPRHLLLDRDGDPVAVAWVEGEGQAFLESCVSGVRVALEPRGSIHFGETIAGEFVPRGTLEHEFATPTLKNETKRK